MSAPPSSYAYSNPLPPAEEQRYRMRWDNFAIVGIAVVVCAVTVPWILTGGDAPGSKAPQARSAAAADATTESLTPEVAIDETLTLSEANALVEQARAAMLGGKFEAAASMLATIGGDISDQSGASALRDENARRQTTHEQLTSQLADLVEQRAWAKASTALAQLAQLAPLTGEMQKTRDMVELELGSERAYNTAIVKLNSGDVRGALEHAQRGYKRFPTPALQGLVERLQKDLRPSNGSASGGGASTAGSGGASASGGGSQASNGGGSTGAAAGASSTASGAATAGNLLDAIGGSAGAAGGATGAVGGEALQGIDPAVLAQLNKLFGSGSTAGAAGAGGLDLASMGVEGLDAGF